MFKSFGFSGNSKYFSNLGGAIDNGFFIACATVGTIILTLGSAFLSGFDFEHSWGELHGFWACLQLLALNPVTVIIIGAILLFIGAVGTYRDQNQQNKDMNSLRNENKQLGDVKNALNNAQEELQSSKSSVLKLHGDLVETWLKILTKHLELDSLARITIYYEDAEEFYLLARHSRNPTYSAIHRQKFPLNQGVISKAWENGEFKEEECPDSEVAYEEYANYLEKMYGYTREKIDSLTMKSCRYFAKAILDADIHVGVIVVESTDHKFLTEDLIKKFDRYCQDHQGQLSKFVRDSLNFDKEISIKREGRNVSVEDDVLQSIGGAV